MEPWKRYPSRQRMYLLKLSKRKDCNGSQTLAEMCSVYLGVELINSSKLSDRVCKACGRRIRNTSELLSVIKLACSQTHICKQAIIKRDINRGGSTRFRDWCRGVHLQGLKSSYSDMPSMRQFIQHTKHSDMQS